MQSVIFLSIVATAILGASGEIRVLGGKDADEGQFPYQAALNMPLPSKPGYLSNCGGSIIGKRWILTAAHCLYDDGVLSATVSIRVGSVSKSTGGRRYESDLLIPHAEYDPQAVTNDIALIRVSEDIEFIPNKVQPVALAKTDETRDGDAATASGWGRSSNDEEAKSPDHLQYLKTTIVTTESCKKLHRSTYDGVVCTKDPLGKGTCSGDSGGPLVNADGVLIGVTSWVTPPCGSGGPGAYTKISAFIDWIEGKMAENDVATFGGSETVDEAADADEDEDADADADAEAPDTYRRRPWGGRWQHQGW